MLQSCAAAPTPKVLPWVSHMSAAPADPVQSLTHSDTFPSRSKTPVNPGTEDWHAGMLPTGTVVLELGSLKSWHLPGAKELP